MEEVYGMKLTISDHKMMDCIYQVRKDIQLELKIIVVIKRIISYPIIYCNPNDILCFRSWLPHMFLSNAQDRYLEKRTHDVDRLDDKRDDLFIKYPKLTREEINKMLVGDLKGRVMKLFVGKSPQKWGTKDRDKNYMREYLDLSAEFGLPRNPDLTKYMPDGNPFIYHLQTEVELQSEGYQYPSQVYLSELSKIASLDINSTLGVTVFEITLCKEPPEMTPEDFMRRVKERVEEDRIRFPARFLSLDMEEIQVLKKVADDLKKLRKNGDKDLEAINTKIPRRGESAFNIPARIIFGNGQTWLASIKFNWTRYTDVNTGEAGYCLYPESFNKKLLDFTQYCSFLVGQNINQDMNKIEEFVKDVFNMKISVPMCLEMNSLLMALGWKIPRTSLFFVNLVTMGGLLNKEVSCADQKWGLPWAELDREFKIYCIGDVRFGHSNFVVLMSLLIRNMFPDVDALCEVLGLSQPQAIDWVSWLICVCLESTGIYLPDSTWAVTRKDLMMSVRDQGYLHKPSPRKVVFLSKLIPDWPIVFNGGARFIQDVLPFFVEQVKVLVEELDVTHPELYPNFPKQVDEEFIKKITYNRGLDRPDIYQGTDTPFLGTRPDVKEKMFNLDPEHITNDDVNSEAYRTKQPKVIGILEQARNCPKFRTALLLKLDEINLELPEYSFWLQKTALYERLKNMNYFLTDKFIQPVVALEDEINRKVGNVVQQEVGAKNRAKKILKNREKREDLYQANHHRSAVSTNRRTGIQQKVYSQIPGDNAVRNKKMALKRLQRLKELSADPNYISKKKWRTMKDSEKRAHEAKNATETQEIVRDLREIVQDKQAARSYEEEIPIEESWNSVIEDWHKPSQRRHRSRSPYSPRRAETRYSGIRLEDSPRRRIHQAHQAQARPLRFRGDNDERSPERIITITREETPERIITLTRNYQEDRSESPARKVYFDKPATITSCDTRSESQDLQQGDMTHKSDWVRQRRDECRYRSMDSPNSPKKKKKKSRGTVRQARNLSPKPDGYYDEDETDEFDPYLEDVDFVNAQMQSYGYYPKKGKSGYNRFGTW